MFPFSASRGTGCVQRIPAANRVTASPVWRQLLEWALTPSTRSPTTKRRAVTLTLAQSGEVLAGVVTNQEDMSQHQHHVLMLMAQAVPFNPLSGLSHPLTGSQWALSGTNLLQQTSWGQTSVGRPPSFRHWDCMTTSQVCSTETPVQT